MTKFLIYESENKDLIIAVEDGLEGERKALAQKFLKDVGATLVCPAYLDKDKNQMKVNIPIIAPKFYEAC